MIKRHKDTLINLDLYDFFQNPKSPKQRQYEAIRAFIMENLSAKIIAKKFNYSINTIYSLLRDAKLNKIELFPEIAKGPKQRRTQVTIQEMIIDLRNQNKSSSEIKKLLKKENIDVSVRTIERILQDAGFSKLKRRTNKELGLTTKNTYLPEVSGKLDFSEIEGIKIDCPCIGIYFFIPYLIESGIIDVIKECNLPKSSVIDSVQASLAMLALKLIGNKRLSQMDAYDHEPGLGIFAGLTVLPKSTYMSTYSCRTNEEMLIAFQEKTIQHLNKTYPELYDGQFINLDFHSIPHYGDEESMEKIWCGAKNKTMKGAVTVFAQDSKNNSILYTRADILRKEESEEIKKFIEYWKKVRKDITETLVFDCTFTKYKILDDLIDQKIRFITLRKRNTKLIQETENIPKTDWKKIFLPIPKRKFKSAHVFETKVKLPGCKNTFRQIIIKNHGRANPTFIIMNDDDLKLASILEIYAKRWHVENKLSELVAFFNLNALSSPLMIRIHFDILMTMIADFLYHRFAKDLRRFEKLLAPKIFKKFINMPGIIKYENDKIEIRIRKRAHTPILMGLEKLNRPFSVPWLGDKKIEIIWTA